MNQKLIICLALILSPGCQPASETQTALPATKRNVVADNTTFAINLYRRLPSGEGNLFFSPYSISTALAMTYGGARGETAKQMAQALQFNLPDHELHTAFATLAKELDAIRRKGQVQLSVANSLWPQSGFEFSREYMDLCRTDYGTAIVPVDFVGHAEDSRQAINRWVEDNTNHKITDLLGSGSVDGARLVLVNAIYFNGKWTKPFDPRNTQNHVFITSTSHVTTPLMHQKDNFRYAEFPDLQVLQLQYSGDDLSMLVFLPRETDGLDKLETKLTPENLALWAAKMPIQKVEVYLPKFKATSEFSLGDTLAGMGMTDAFDPNNKADFSAMDGRKDLYISKVVHKAFVDVNEEGTEAAAATGGYYAEYGAEPRPKPIPIFRADHPFLFLIRDNRTGSILFLGRMTNPAQ